MPLQAAAAKGDTEAVRQALQVMAQSLQAMTAALERMHDKCDPHIYYERVRLPTSGWRDNPAMPYGLLYEGMPSLQIQAEPCRPGDAACTQHFAKFECAAHNLACVCNIALYDHVFTTMKFVMANFMLASQA